MWGVLADSPSFQAAYERLCLEYDLDPSRLRRDLEELLGELVSHELIEIHAP
jgi:hypothetical protein